jgi:large subunit ribosomal protein L35
MSFLSTIGRSVLGQRAPMMMQSSLNFCSPLTNIFVRSFGHAPGSKTKGALKKRFKLTGSGKVMRKKCGSQHKAFVKTRKQISNLNTTGYVDGKIGQNLKRMFTGVKLR